MNIIDIGSGPHPKADANIRVDVHQWPGVTHVHDLNIFPYPFEDNFADKIYLGDVIEHMIFTQAPLVLDELRRILKPGCNLEVTCPDLRWVFESLIKGTWKQDTMGVGWLNRRDTDWESAMDYVFGGFRNENEYMIPGMGHVNGFDHNYLHKLLYEAGFSLIYRDGDERNPPPLCNAILKIIATK